MMSACLQRTGKVGKPPKLPAVVFNNRLLLQLNALKEENNKTWSEIEEFFEKLFPNDNFPPIVPLIRSAVQQFTNTKGETEEFLNHDRDINFPGPFCKQMGISRNALMNEQVTVSSPVSISNGLVLELANFALKQKLKSDVVFKWMNLLSNGRFSASSISRLNNSLTQTKLTCANLRKKRSLAGGESTLELFLQAPFGDALELEQSASQVSSSESSVMPAVSSQFNSSESFINPAHSTQLNPLSESPFNEKLLSKHSAELKKKENEIRLKEEKIKENAEFIDFLETLCKEKDQIISNLRKKVDKLPAFKEEVEHLKLECEKYKNKLQEKDVEVRSLKHSAVYARLVRRERELRKARALVNEAAKKDVRKDKIKLHSFQKEMSVVKKRLAESVEKNKETAKKLKEAEKEIQQNIHLIQAGENQMPVLKDDKTNHFKDNVVTCTAQLVGECDIAARLCGQVIKTVARHIFGCDIPDSQLPSKSTAFRFADVGHVIAKMHLREEMTSQSFDLHCDGTSRTKNKFVGQQVTLADHSSLSLGFQLVAREDAQSLLHITLNMFDELAYLDLGGNSEDQVKTMLRNMVGIMTDRAAVMKSFQDATERKKMEILQSQEGITRLYCNAHFLLALSLGASAALASMEKVNNLTKKLGRDTLPAFRRFSNEEPAAIRIIRLVCDVLGPRGDEKNGCRDDWTAFCALRDKTSRLGSFRGNRFNNLFESAAGIIYHKDDIYSFFTTYKEPSNLKQLSIVHDMQSPIILAMVGALAVCYIFVTGPFWRLIKSDTHYLDQGLYIQNMYGNLLAARDCDTIPDLLTRCPTALQGFGLPHCNIADSVYIWMNNLSPDFAGILKNSVLSMLTEFSQATYRQLKQFLAGGVYSTPATPEQREKMSHCKLNNLFGEACLGDLDFSLFKRRHSSVHHHSTINMLKRNKPISKFLLTKSEPEQEQILSFARLKAAPLREEHRAQESAVIRERQQVALQQRAKAERLKGMRERRRLQVVRDLQRQGGLCFDRNGVERLLASQRTKTAKFSALSIQLRYHKIFLGSKNRLLNKAKLSINEIKENLIQYLESMDGDIPAVPANLPLDENLPTEDEQPARKRPRHFSHQSDGEEETSLPTTQHEGLQLQRDNGNFSQGQIVAVYYDDSFYVGEVLQVKRDGTAEVTFMDQVPSKNIFRWRNEDTDIVDRNFVFMWNVKITRQNGRTWSVSDYERLVALYHLFQETYCTNK